MSEKQVVVQQPSNGLGTAGFVVSLVGLVLTCGALCPIGMILSFFGLFKEPRGLAIAGFIIGLLGGGWFLIAGMLVAAGMLAAFVPAAAVFATNATMEEMERGVVEYRQEHGEWPTADYVSGNFEAEDSWGNPIRFQLRGNGYELRSAGPDEKLRTDDDIVKIGN